MSATPSASTLPGASFDAATGGFMIFFPPDPPQVLREIRRVLRPRGRVALSVFDGAAGFPFQSELQASIGAIAAPGPGSRFNEAAVLRASLVEAGLLDVDTVEMRERFHFATVEEVERWQRSTGVRRVLESLDDGQLASYRAGLAERLEPFAADGGGFVLEQRAVAVVADAPG